MKSVKELLNYGTHYLKEHNKEEQAARIFLMEVLKKDSTWLINNMERKIEKKEIQKYKSWLKRFVLGEPLQYIVGNVIFYGYKFTVNKNVLIPRFETEELVENILLRINKKFQNYKQINLVDIGTGSGVIAITLKLKEPKLQVIGTDISKEAILLAKKNAESLNTKVDFLVGNLFEPIKNKKFDIVVSNPPYISENEELDALVKENEPHIALFGGKDGLKYYRLILKNVEKILNEKAMIAFEIGSTQKDEIIKLIHKYLPSTTYEVLKDMQGRDRMVFIYKDINTD